MMCIKVVNDKDMYDWLLLLDPFTNMWADAVALVTVRDRALHVGQGKYFATESAIDAYMYAEVL